MPDTDRRDPANMALRARIERLRALHRELQAVSASAADTAVQTARGVPSETANRQLNVLVQKGEPDIGFCLVMEFPYAKAFEYQA